MATIRKLPNGRWQAQYRAVSGGKVFTKTTVRKTDAQDWLDRETSKLVTGTWTTPKTAKTTVAAWCRDWLTGYGTRKESTVRQARTHVAQIVAEFGTMPLASVRPSHVKAWTAKLTAGGYEASYVYVLHGRLAQVFADAVHDGIVPRSPCSRRTSPRQGSQRPYVATTAQVWALADAMPDHTRLSVLLGAFAGLRVAEVCGLRVADVAFLYREIRPAVQYPADELKTEMSRTAVPIADALVTAIAEQVKVRPAATVLTFHDGGQLGPWQLQRDFRRARAAVDGIPAGFRFHDLRHYFASLLIASGADVKVVQHRLRHASAKTTLDCYGHLWPDTDESTRTAVERVMSARIDDAVDSLSNGGGAD